MIKGIYLHESPPFNGPFFTTPPFCESQKRCDPPSVSSPPPPRPTHAGNFWQVPITPNFLRANKMQKKYEEISVNVVNIACAHELIQPHVDYHANAVFTIFAADLIPPSCTFLHHICGEKVPP